MRLGQARGLTLPDLARWVPISLAKFTTGYGIERRVIASSSDHPDHPVFGAILSGEVGILFRKIPLAYHGLYGGNGEATRQHLEDHSRNAPAISNSRNSSSVVPRTIGFSVFAFVPARTAKPPPAATGSNPRGRTVRSLMYWSLPCRTRSALVRLVLCRPSGHGFQAGQSSTISRDTVPDQANG